MLALAGCFFFASNNGDCKLLVLILLPKTSPIQLNLIKYSLLSQLRMISAEMVLLMFIQALEVSLQPI